MPWPKPTRNWPGSSKLVGSAESIWAASVDATSKLAYRALSAPIIKTVAVTSGASRARQATAQGVAAMFKRYHLDGGDAGTALLAGQRSGPSGRSRRPSSSTCLTRSPSACWRPQPRDWARRSVRPRPKDARQCAPTEAELRARVVDRTFVGESTPASAPGSRSIERSVLRRAVGRPANQPHSSGKCARVDGPTSPARRWRWRLLNVYARTPQRRSPHWLRSGSGAWRR